MLNGLKVLVACVGMAVAFLLCAAIIPEKYRETVSGPFTAIVVIAIVLFLLYMVIFEPEDFHAVNENLRDMPRR